MTNENPIVPAGEGSSERREAVREKAQKVKARQKRAKILRRGGVVLLILAVVAAVVYGVVSVVAPTVSKPLLTPENMEGDAIVVGEGDDLTAMGGIAEDTGEGDEQPRASAVDIRIYVDYLADGAAQFEQENSAQLAKWVGQGAANLSYHPVALLTSKSNGTKYSVRAAGAVACVRTHAPETAIAFNHQLLVVQPRLDDDGYSDTELAEQAIALGVADTQKVRDCIENEDFVPWAGDATQRALEKPLPDTDGVELAGAPVILVNGQPYTGSLTDPAEFAQFVLTVSSDAYYSTPAPGATPEPEETAEPEATEEPAPEESEEPAPEEETAPEEEPAE